MADDKKKKSPFRAILLCGMALALVLAGYYGWRYPDSPVGKVIQPLRDMVQK